MRIGFYLTGGQSVENVLPLIARAAMGQGQRLLVVAGDKELLDRLDKALWETAPEEFLAHGFAGEGHDDRQPIVLAQECVAPNGAEIVALADGEWRSAAEGFARALLFFDKDGRAAARETWRRFDGRDDVEREFHEHVGGKWVKRA